MKYTKEEFEEALEVLFDNLDTRSWEDSFISATHEYSEPNTLFKVTVDDKIGLLRETLVDYVEELEEKAWKYDQLTK